MLYNREFLLLRSPGWYEPIVSEPSKPRGPDSSTGDISGISCRSEK